MRSFSLFANCRRDLTRSVTVEALVIMHYHWWAFTLCFGCGFFARYMYQELTANDLVIEAGRVIVTSTMVTGMGMLIFGIFLQFNRWWMNSRVSSRFAWLTGLLSLVYGLAVIPVALQIGRDMALESDSVATLLFAWYFVLPYLGSAIITFSGRGKRDIPDIPLGFPGSFTDQPPSPNLDEEVIKHHNMKM